MDMAKKYSGYDEWRTSKVLGNLLRKTVTAEVLHCVIREWQYGDTVLYHTTPGTPLLMFVQGWAQDKAQAREKAFDLMVLYALTVC